MRVLLILCSLVLVVVLTASTTVDARGSTSLPTRLHATSTAVRGAGPLDVTVQDEAAVQRVYQAAYRLEPVPPGAVFHCPLNAGPMYMLDFFQGDKEVQQMHLDATGCRFLQIGAGGDTRFTTDEFNALVARTLGIPSLVPSTR